MSITNERKAELIKQYGRGEGDTGSPEVQVAILTERIRNLTEHFKEHHKDNHSPSRSPEDGWPAPPLAGLSEECQRGALQGTDR